MPIHARIRPALTGPDALRVAADHFGLDATTARELPSERDQNFRLETTSGEPFVLKLAHAGEERSVLDFQNRMLEHLAGTGLAVPRVVPAPGGDEIVEVAHGDHAFPARLLTWLPGTVLARVRPRPPELLAGLGRFLGRLDRALDGFDHLAADRPLYWNLQRAGEEIRSRAEYVTDPGRRATLERLTERHLAALEPLIPALRESVIHGDANDHNVLVTRFDPDARLPDGRPDRRIAGLLDFGDAVRSYTVAEPAIAAAYAMLGRSDPLGAAAAVVAGYHGVHPLRDEEIAALFPLMVLRLCTSVAVSAHQRGLEPELDYLGISEAPAWEALRLLEDDPGHLPRARFRHACGLEPVPGGRGVVAWLEAHGDDAAPVVRPVDPAAPAHVLDFSVTSTEFGIEPAPADAPGWTAAIFARMAAAGARVGIGRYDEVRPWYTAPGFQAPSDEAPAWRTVHLGVDLFLEPGSPVHAPFDAIVHSVADNAGPLDYGPTVILEHRIPDDDGSTPFWTLYGHLAPDVLDALEPGRAIARGEAFAGIGDYPRNGGWAPHLHVQLLLDPLGMEGNFPGVAPPSQRDFWTALSPDPAPLLGLGGHVSGAPLDPDTGLDRDEILARRRAHLGPNLSITYARPLKIVRGRGTLLYDDAGQPHLDCVNNVPHVGHAHPRVVAAGQAQMALLNTNTRYLHDTIVEYAERLLALFPDPLDRVYFVCTGSEANELALRMARTHTGREDVVVVEGGYHGNTSTLVDLSHYKFAGPGGRGAPDWVHVTPLPDPYRGRYRRSVDASDGGNPADRADSADPTDSADPAGLGRRYAEAVGRVVAEAAERGRPPAAFLAEPLVGCGGQIVPPPGWLAGAYERVRAAGGVCIADEVQVGFGRVGSHLWAFQAQGVVPDIVTLGKPMGNGHPLAAVVTTAAIAESFDTGMEYFNTFGGNPVSCAIGMAVLDVLEEEGLQANARAVGDHLLRELSGLDHPLIGEVRGQGLYVGVELVTDRAARTPATGLARRVKERLRDHRILLSTDGPDDNVLKIKPPLVFSEADADRLVDTLARVLAEDEFRREGGTAGGAGPT